MGGDKALRKLSGWKLSGFIFAMTLIGCRFVSRVFDLSTDSTARGGNGAEEALKAAAKYQAKESHRSKEGEEEKKKEAAKKRKLEKGMGEEEKEAAVKKRKLEKASKNVKKSKGDTAPVIKPAAQRRGRDKPLPLNTVNWWTACSIFVAATLSGMRSDLYTSQNDDSMQVSY